MARRNPPSDTAFPGKRQEIFDNYRRHLATKDPPCSRPYIYLSYVRRYLEFVGRRALNRATVEGFMAQMEAEKKKATTRSFILGVLRILFNTNGLEWPEGIKAPRVLRGARRMRGLHPEAVRQMIRTATSGRYDPAEAAAVALATTWGLCRKDIVRINASDLRFDDKIITFFTPSKDSTPRTHMIPPEILPVLEAWDLSTPLTNYSLEAMWYRLEEKAGIPHIKGVGWRTVRLTLTTELRKAVNSETGQALSPTTLSLFMGWSGDTKHDMTNHDVTLEYVGWGDQEVQPSLEAMEDVDTEIFAIHPFLPAWREDG